LLALVERAAGGAAARNLGRALDGRQPLAHLTRHDVVSIGIGSAVERRQRTGPAVATDTTGSAVSAYSASAYSVRASRSGSSPASSSVVACSARPSTTPRPGTHGTAASSGALARARRGASARRAAVLAATALTVAATESLENHQAQRDAERPTSLISHAISPFLDFRQERSL
jgi:hypothetical protein